MIVVSDTTPLITLMKVGRLGILGKLFGEVLIPRAVFHELTVNAAYADEAALVRESDFIRVVDVADVGKVALLRRATGLDLGESEAIVYADDEGADLLLMDEAAGRRVARNMGLPMAGSVGILIRAHRSGWLTLEETEGAFEIIRGSNRRISEALLRSALYAIRNGS